MVLAISHALRAHEALGRPDTLGGILEVVHRLFEDGIFVGHDQKYRDERHVPRCDAQAALGRNAALRAMVLSAQ